MAQPAQPSDRPRPDAVVLFAGGGTGGHIYPGLAIAEHLAALARARGRTLSCRFICSDRAIDRAILEREQAEFEPSPAKPLATRPMGLLRFIRAWGPAVRHARRAIATARATAVHRDRVHLVAMGGFVAAPAAQAARVERCPITLVNLDAAPGKANRWIARRAGSAFTTFPVAAHYAREWRSIPPIVRSAAVDPRSPAEARAALGLDASRPTLMITGGSQGAGSINRFLAALAREQPGTLAGWQVLHQTGDDDNAALADAYARAGVPARVEKFVPGIGLWWRAADLAIARAGAGSVAEAWANAVPTLFLPYPWHKDQHQRLNAQPLVAAGAAALGTDLIEPAANVRELGPALAHLLQTHAARQAMADALARLGPADGAPRVAQSLAPFLFP